MKFIGEYWLLILGLIIGIGGPGFKKEKTLGKHPNAGWRLVLCGTAVAAFVWYKGSGGFFR